MARPETCSCVGVLTIARASTSTLSNSVVNLLISLGDTLIRRYLNLLIDNRKLELIPYWEL